MNEEFVINVLDYLPPERITEIAEEQLGAAFARQVQREANIERVLVNLSHEYVFRLMVEQVSMNRDAVEKCIADGISKALQPETIRYEVFRRKDAWDRDESPAVKILDECLKECKPKVEEMVNQIIEEYPFYELRENILDTVYECIERMLTRKDPPEVEHVSTTE